MAISDFEYHVRPMNITRYNINRLLLALPLTIATIADIGFAQGGRPPALVQVAPVKSESITERRVVVGWVKAVRYSIVGATETGRVVTMNFDDGDPVKTDDVIAQLEDRLLNVDLKLAEQDLLRWKSTVTGAQAEFDLAAREADRRKILAENRTINLKEYEDAVDRKTAANARLEQARIAVEAAKLTIDQLKIRLEKKKIKAPFNGIITRQNAEVGNWVGMGATIVEVADVSRVDIQMNVPEAMVVLLSEDQEIELRVESTKAERSGRIHRIIPSGDPDTKTFPIIVRLDNSDQALKPGMSVRAYLPVGKTIEAVTVPRDAVRTTPTGAMVYVNRSGVATMVPVNVRFSHGDRLVVNGSLADGDQVVVEGNERLTPGQPVRVANTDKPAATEK